MSERVATRTAVGTSDPGDRYVLRVELRRLGESYRLAGGGCVSAWFTGDMVEFVEQSSFQPRCWSGSTAEALRRLSAAEDRVGEGAFWLALEG